ncbi:MAG: glycosyltransferase [Lachnospiraceae bacterium]|nr:glycosyltransferase [Lachnospiraceae bacterium]
MIAGISIILLAYNEEDNLRSILPKIKENIGSVHEKYEIIVVDTATPTDNSKDVCVENSVMYVNQHYPGFGGALRTGIEIASLSHVITIDSDGAHNPRYIPKMVSMYNSNKYDVVIGSRYVKGGGTNDPWVNIIMSKVLNNVYGFVFGLKAKDLSTNFRMYRLEDIKKLSLECVNYDVLQEILIKIKWSKQGIINIGEFPIVLEKRVFGKSKRKLISFIISYISTLISLKRIEHKASS